MEKTMNATNTKIAATAAKAALSLLTVSALLLALAPSSAEARQRSARTGGPNIKEARQVAASSSGGYQIRELRQAAASSTGGYQIRELRQVAVSSSGQDVRFREARALRVAPITNSYARTVQGQEVPQVHGLDTKLPATQSLSLSLGQRFSRSWYRLSAWLGDALTIVQQDTELTVTESLPEE